MAKAKLKSTDTLGKMDAKQLAEMLRRKGRRGDTILAHITPREARKLKAEGGSGTINPETGLPEFFEDFGGYDVGGYDLSSYGDFSFPQAQPVFEQYAGDYGATPQGYDVTAYNEPAFAEGYGGTSFPMSADYSGFGAQDAMSAGGYEVGGQVPGGQSFLPPLVGTPADVPMPPPRPEEFGGRAGAYDEYQQAAEEQKATEGKTPEEKSYLEKLFGKLDLGTLAKLGLAGGAALMGRSQQQQAIKQAEAAAAQMRAAYNKASQGYKGLAETTRGPAITAFTQAQQGILDPARLQQIEIARARLAQSGAGKTAVGAIQSAEAMNRARQEALLSQQQAALQLLGPSNTLLSQAIQAQLQGTTSGLSFNLQLQQQANQAAANLYGQLGRYMAG